MTRKLRITLREKKGCFSFVELERKKFRLNTLQSKPGVYKIRWALKSHPKTIQRLNGKDFEGIHWGF
jgi:hypothetical protein